MTEDNHSIRREIAALLPRLRRFGRTLTGNDHDADDLTQVTVERALTRSHQLRPDSRLDSWMFTIMKNAWFDELRSRSRRTALALGDETAEPAGNWSAEDEANMLEILQAMQTLPDQQRLVAGLVLVEGMSYQEAADILEVPPGTVMSRLSRARKALQLALLDDSINRADDDEEQS